MVIAMRSVGFSGPLECQILYRRIANRPSDGVVSAWVFAHAVYCELEVDDLSTREIAAGETMKALEPILHEADAF
ncbi:hypothetical protein DL769_006770 [Monosporascus sp. CRB-8-3]|nr:hypothetical protein DL769_006770 [Monosporascus sp. CRB-8-3]